MNNLIAEIKNSLAHNNYLSALTLSLVIVDICGKILYPNDGVGQRFRKWYDEYISKYDIPKTETKEETNLTVNGDIAYLLRNTLLHEGSLNVEDDIHKKYGLKKHQKLRFMLTNSGWTKFLRRWEGDSRDRDPDIIVEISVEHFCQKIYRVAENFYYKHNPSGDIYNEIVSLDFKGISPYSVE